MDFLNRSLKAQMRLANKLNVNFVIIVGQEELKEQKIMIKNMSDGEQKKVALSQILSYLQ